MDAISIIELDRELLSFFNQNDNLLMDGVIKTLTSGITWIPLYLSLFYMVVKNNETMGQIFFIVGGVLLSIMLSGGVDDLIIKPLVARPRPLNDLATKYVVDTVYGVSSNQFSFFSAHAANTFALATFMALLVRSGILNFGLFVWAAINAYTRLYLGMHYPSDILVGTLWGMISGAIAYFVYSYLYYKRNPHINYISSQYTSTGYSFIDVDIVITILSLTVLYALVTATVNVF
ncbi:MAG: phosphatase PAP2 family protein [Prevotella sp.]|nr:phosphatase PAP2 family protein [Prevotella sp.]MBP8038482.1 phosphatase PAP2 family protein [Prevotella sp.]MBP8756975.1 phosphatase PAP2 family protein [Prevotella sp.]MBP9984907.1 phosphatase PAP2 family protein [Prevotella sp.]MDY0153768.1 phosphatase PAP2 family protein [Prevotella sp.]